MTETGNKGLRQGTTGSSQGQSHGVPQEPTKFDLLCDTVDTAMVTLNGALQEFFALKNELLKHTLPPKLLVHLTLTATRIFRCYSDLCTPVGELTRLAQLYSAPWEQKSGALRRLKEDHSAMQRQLNIALKKIEMMAAEEERNKHEQRLRNWERLFARVMGAKSHGRRWKFRIEPFRKRLEEGLTPYVSDTSDDSEDEEYGIKKAGSPLEGSEDELKLGSSSEGEEDEMLRGLSSNSRARTSSSQKRVRFADNDPSDAPPTPPTPPSPAPPPVETCDATTWTGEPQYNNYLLVQAFRPNGMMPAKDLRCTLSLGDQYYSSKPFSCTPDPNNLLVHQDFHFSLSDDAARTLPPHPQEPLNSIEVTKLNVAVYPASGGDTGAIAAHVSIAIRDLTLTDIATVLVPSACSEEPFILDWEGVATEVQGPPTEYSLNCSGEGEGQDEDDMPLVPLICHRVKVQRHQAIHSGTTTLAWDDLMLELGYHQLPESQSRAVSAIYFDEDPQDKEEPEPQDQISQEEAAEMALKHAEEMKKLQDKYEHRLQDLSRSLAKVRTEQAKQIEELEQALVESEQSKGKRLRSPSEIRNMLARKRKPKLTHGLPEWGKDLPEDFFERLELFAYESVRRQEELTQRIKKEVSEACEKQLATQHKLAPGLRTDIDATTEDVSLPALFMPSPASSKAHNIYTPRAHGYFHPPRSADPRITQPPSMLKLPTLHKSVSNPPYSAGVERLGTTPTLAVEHLPTLNLFELSQHFSQSGPQWLRDSQGQSPHYTPAPPPSACGFYRDTSTPLQK